MINEAKRSRQRPRPKTDVSKLYTPFGQHYFWPQTLHNVLLSVHQQEAQLSQRDRATRYVSWNLVSCCITVLKVAFEKGCSRRMTVKVTQGHQIWRFSIGHTSRPNIVSNVSVLCRFRDITTLYSVRDYLWLWEIRQFRHDNWNYTGHLRFPFRL